MSCPKQRGALQTSPLALGFGSEETSTLREVNCKTEEGSDIRIGGCDVVLNDRSPSVAGVIRRNRSK